MLKQYNALQIASLTIESTKFKFLKVYHQEFSYHSQKVRKGAGGGGDLTAL